MMDLNVLLILEARLLGYQSHIRLLLQRCRPACGHFEESSHLSPVLACEVRREQNLVPGTKILPFFRQHFHAVEDFVTVFMGEKSCWRFCLGMVSTNLYIICSSMRARHKIQIAEGWKWQRTFSGQESEICKRRQSCRSTLLPHYQ